jgi:modulator of FtsH protease HflK
MAGNSGGPWGGGGSGGGNRGNNGSGGNGGPGGPRRPGGDQQIPELDEIVRKGQEQLRVLMGGRGGRTGGGGGGGGDGFKFTRGTAGLIALAVAGFWAFQSFYTVRPEEQSVELFLGEFYSIGNPGLNFAPWPLVTAEVLNVTSRKNREYRHSATSARTTTRLMLTTDENIVDIDFEVVWNISTRRLPVQPAPTREETIRAVSEAAMREVIATSQLAPILNRDRGLIADTVQDADPDHARQPTTRA